MKNINWNKILEEARARIVPQRPERWQSWLPIAFTVLSPFLRVNRFRSILLLMLAQHLAQKLAAGKK